MSFFGSPPVKPKQAPSPNIVRVGADVSVETDPAQDTALGLSTALGIGLIGLGGYLLLRQEPKRAPWFPPQRHISLGERLKRAEYPNESEQQRRIRAMSVMNEWRERERREARTGIAEGPYSIPDGPSTPSMPSLARRPDYYFEDAPDTIPDTISEDRISTRREEFLRGLAVRERYGRSPAMLRRVDR